MRLLCSSDLHIGRRSSRLPDDVSPITLSTSEAWNRLVEAAIKERVDAVLLAGDVVDRKNRFFEATGPLENGVRRLGNSGIATVAVCGNHDHDVLPPLVKDLAESGFRLLGARGTWERFTLDTRGDRLHIDGWSFPTLHYTADPLADYDLEPDGAPIIGLLHADLGAADSRYAPVVLAALRAKPVTGWVLGHSHASASDTGTTPPVFYPGSLQALDPGEPGPHGAWLLDVSAGGGIQSIFVPLSAVRYETRSVDLGGVDDIGELNASVVREVRSAMEAAADDGGFLRILSLRLRLFGRTGLHRRVESLMMEAIDDLQAEWEGLQARIERIYVQTAPPLDLAALARGNDAPAVVAGLVKALQAGTPDERQQRLIRKISDEFEGVRTARPFLPVQDRPDSFLPSEILQDRALLLLDTLVAQKEGK